METDRQNIEIRKMREFVNLEGKIVLEVGCGDGRASAMLSRFAASLVAIDPDEKRLSNARSNVRGVDFRLGYGEKLEFSDGSFDIVAFTFSLHHQDSAKALDEAKRVLKPSGNVLIIEPAIGGDMHPLFSIFRDEDPQITAARNAIGRCGMALAKAGAFDIEYAFDDVDDVYRYFFGHFGVTGEKALRKKIDHALAGKATQRPIRLLEAVNIYTLLKTY